MLPLQSACDTGLFPKFPQVFLCEHPSHQTWLAGFQLYMQLRS